MKAAFGKCKWVPDVATLSLVQVKNEVEKLPRQQRKESMKQKMEEHAQKKQLLVSLCLLPPLPCRRP